MHPETHPALPVILMLLFLSTGCQDMHTQPPPRPTPTLTALHQPLAKDSTPTSDSPTQVALPTTEALSQIEVPQAGVIRLPVPDTAYETAAALFAAAHPARDDFALATQLSGVEPSLLVPALAETPLEVNSRMDFYLNANLNGEYRAIPARLRFLSEHAAWWTSVSARATDEGIASAAEFFEREVLPINQLIFGIEASPGIDGDSRIHILLVEEPLWGSFFGYFSNINQYPSALQPFSNEREMFVINLGGVRMDSVAFGGELAHEYQHLIHWNLDANEDLWLNEAMGELATFLTGSPQGAAVAGRCEGSKSNLELFSCHPDLQLTARPERRFGDQDLTTLAHYGAERLLMVYLLEQFGPSFIKTLANNPEPGVLSVQQELDKLPDAPRFEDVFANWLLANLLIQPNLLEGQFGYREILPVRPVREIIHSFDGELIADQLPPFGARYYELQADQDVSVSFSGSTLARLTPVDPAGGRYAWYSNRGDQSAFRMTRSFDLTGLEEATLHYKVWFELEDYYDFAYLEISTDGGKTWTILPTAHGTGDDPEGRSYGWGYTGTLLSWEEETIDLSPYSGQVIQIRFEVLTDFTTNRDGFQLDDIEIPELGYFDGAEDETGGWDTEGFLRSTNFVPVEWVGWLVELTQPTRVTRITLDSEQAAGFNISGFGKDFPFAALVISPTAPVTTLEVDYELTFQAPE